MYERGVYYYAVLLMYWGALEITEVLDATVLKFKAIYDRIYSVDPRSANKVKKYSPMWLKLRNEYNMMKLYNIKNKIGFPGSLNSIRKRRVIDMYNLRGIEFVAHFLGVPEKDYERLEEWIRRDLAK